MVILYAIGFIVLGVLVFLCLAAALRYGWRVTADAVCRRLFGAHDWNDDGVVRAWVHQPAYRVELTRDGLLLALRAPPLNLLRALLAWAIGYVIVGLPLLKVAFGGWWIGGLMWVPSEVTGYGWALGGILAVSGMVWFLRFRSNTTLMLEPDRPVRVIWRGAFGVKRELELARPDALGVVADGGHVVLLEPHQEEPVRLMALELDRTGAAPELEQIEADLARLSEALRARCS